MMNDNMQHLGFAPQIPTLTPAEMRNQSTLDRLTAFLRSLVLIPGEGINVRRDGSSGTVVESVPLISEPSIPARRCINIAGLTIKCPALSFGLSDLMLDQAVTISVPAVTWTFTNLPGRVWLTWRGKADSIQWVHDSLNGSDATTQGDYMTEDYDLCHGAYSYTDGVIDIASIMPGRNNRWRYEIDGTTCRIVPPAHKYYADPGYTSYETWDNSSGQSFNRKAYFWDGTLTSNSNNNLYLKISDEWWTSYTSGLGTGLNIYLTTSKSDANYIYYPVGYVWLDASNNVKAIVGPRIPEWFLAPFNKTVGTPTVALRGIVTTAT